MTTLVHLENDILAPALTINKYKIEKMPQSEIEYLITLLNRKIEEAKENKFKIGFTITQSEAKPFTDATQELIKKNFQQFRCRILKYIVHAGCYDEGKHLHTAELYYHTIVYEVLKKQKYLYKGKVLTQVGYASIFDLRIPSISEFNKKIRNLNGRDRDNYNNILYDIEKLFL